MRIVAVLACRNEAAYLPTCLHHLVSNGIDFAIVDNDSTDDSLSIAHRPQFRDHLTALARVPFDGVFHLERILEAKMALVETIRADWIMHIDADEMIHPNRKGTTVLKEVELFDQHGFNAVNCDEFVFLPVEQPYEEGLCGWPRGRHYYFFEPARFRLMRLWKAGQRFSMVRHGGHRVDGDGVRFAPESFTLRHYIFRNQDHAFSKYPTRMFAEDELARGWHGNRHGIPRANYRFPPLESLECLSRNDSFVLSRSHPRAKHYWEP